MLGRLIGLMVLVPTAAVLVALCVVNRQGVTLALNPFWPDDPVLRLSAPFFVFILVVLMTGCAIGAAVTWVSQGKHRKRSRAALRSAAFWQAETRKRDDRAGQASAQTLPRIGRSHD